MDDAIPKVIIVDDEECVQKSLGRLIRCAGWRSHAVSSAYDLMTFEDWDDVVCILLDIRMPGMNGLQLHEWLLEKGVTVPVAFLAGYGDAAISMRTARRGALGFLLKPADIEVLLATIREAIALNSRSNARTASEKDQAVEWLPGRAECSSITFWSD
jgi:two-component system, LuxR family, response regulator TtrR